MKAGVDYLFLGDALGGRPPEPDMYDHEGHVRYGALAETPRFRAGLDRLREAASQGRVAMMCSEENPADCHRRLLVTRALLNDDPACLVTHIRGDGSVIGEADMSRTIDPYQQGCLLEEEPPWRSARSVSPNTQQRVSSRT